MTTTASPEPATRRSGLRTRISAQAVPLGLGLVAFALAFAQRPGRAFTDTRIELSVDPGLFLARVSQLWSSTTDLGHVQSGQFVGYLFPMGPYFAFCQWLGLPTWVAQRLWIGALLALGAWGVVRLMDELYDRRRGVAPAVAGLLFLANPFVVIYMSRATVVFLAYAALPWFLLATHRGLRSPRRWAWPAVIGLLVSATAGGVNFAVLIWVLAAMPLLALYEVVTTRVGWRAVWSFGWRASVCAVIGGAWWAVPVFLQSRYGADFLAFTEQPSTIFRTNSASEALRLMGLWLGYLGAGTGGTAPVLPTMSTYLFSRSVILVTFLVPFVALGGLAWTRRWSYAPFFGLLAVLAVGAMAVGFPPGSGANDALTWTYYHVTSLQFLRTTHKAAPLLALALACLGGAAAAYVVERARAGTLVVLGSRVPVWALAVLLVIPVFWARPLFTGQAVDAELAYDAVPAPWRTAIADDEARSPKGTRTAILPGELFGWYRWGGTWDPVAPALSRRSILIRETSRYADPRASQLQTSIDDRLQQARLVPGQLDPLLRFMGVGAVLVDTDGKRLHQGSLDPAGVRDALADQALVRRPDGTFGPVTAFLPVKGRGGTLARLPQIRRYLPAGPTTGIVRVHPQAGATVLDGDGDGVAALAAHGALDPRRGLFYAGDLKRSEVASFVHSGATLAFSDSNRRRVLLASELTQNVGPTLGANDPVDRLWPMNTLFPSKGSSAQTVAEYGPLAYLRSPSTPGFALIPARRPYAAFDGDPNTAWIADHTDPRQRYIQLALRTPQNVPTLRVLPYDSGAGSTRTLFVSVNGGPERKVRLRGGWNDVGLSARPLRTLRLRVGKVTGALIAGQGGLAEVRIPGLSVRESLRLPTELATMAGGLDVSRNPMEVLLERTTADFPYRVGADDGDLQTLGPLRMLDAEPGIERDVTLPAGRAFTADGWASVAATASDSALDRLAGLPADWRFSSSSRFEGVPGNRASSAFDGDPRTAWIADDIVGAPTPWITWQAPSPVRFDRLRITPGRVDYKAPSRVRVWVGATPYVRSVAADGTVRLGHTVRTSTARIEVVSARRPTAAQRLRGLDAVAIAEIDVPRLDPPAVRRTGTFATACGVLSVRSAGAATPLRVHGTVAQLDAGRALAMTGCGDPLPLHGGRNAISVRPGAVMRADQLRLRGRPTASQGLPAPATPTTAARITDPGTGGFGDREGAKIQVSGPSWLVLGESFSRGWRAWCRDAKGKETALGAPVPADGYANGWRIAAGCVGARFAFAPQATATAAYAVSAVGCVGLLALVGVAWWRRRRRPTSAAAAPESRAPAFDGPPADPLRRLSWGWTLLAAAFAGGIGALLVALPAAVAFALGTVVLVREGAGARRCFLAAGVLLLAIPASYLLNPSTDLGGYNFDYAKDQMGGHWLAMAALLLVSIGCALDLRRRRRSTGTHA